jgi:SEC-C motif
VREQLRSRCTEWRECWAKQAIELLIERMALEDEMPGSECVGVENDPGFSNGVAELPSRLAGKPPSLDSVPEESSVSEAPEAEELEPTTDAEVQGKVAGAAKAPSRRKPCPCGSGRKFKDCCRKAERSRVDPTPAEKIAMAELRIMTSAIYV